MIRLAASGCFPYIIEESFINLYQYFLKFIEIKYIFFIIKKINIGKLIKDQWLCCGFLTLNVVILSIK